MSNIVLNAKNCLKNEFINLPNTYKKCSFNNKPSHNYYVLLSIVIMI